MASINLHRVSKITIEGIGESVEPQDGVRKILIANDEGEFEILLFGLKSDLKIKMPQETEF